MSTTVNPTPQADDALPVGAVPTSLMITRALVVVATTRQHGDSNQMILRDDRAMLHHGFAFFGIDPNAPGDVQDVIRRVLDTSMEMEACGRYAFVPLWSDLTSRLTSLTRTTQDQ